MKSFDMRNIKTRADGYQICYVINGKSYTNFTKDLDDAKSIRDDMENELSINPHQTLKDKPLKGKTSCYPNSNEPLPVGITFLVAGKMFSVTKEISLRSNWKDSSGKNRMKTFYIGTENTYTLGRFYTQLERAVEFREKYARHVGNGTLDQFDGK